MGVVSVCAYSFMSKYLHQSCSPKPMTRVDINDNNQSSNTYHVPKKYQIMYQTCTKPCINHVPKPIPYHVPNLYQIMHQPKPVPFHVPTLYHASTMYITMHKCHQGMPHTYTKNVSQTMCPISKMLLKPCASNLYHITHHMSQLLHTPCTIRYHQ
jgi:hypothetical protein